jgi:hypothetical protein
MVSQGEEKNRCKQQKILLGNPVLEVPGTSTWVVERVERRKPGWNVFSTMRKNASDGGGFKPETCQPTSSAPRAQGMEDFQQKKWRFLDSFGFQRI